MKFYFKKSEKKAFKRHLKEIRAVNDALDLRIDFIRAQLLQSIFKTK